MAEANPTKLCAVCQQPFIIKTNNRGHAKYCSRKCQRSAQSNPTGGKTKTSCQNCGKEFEFYPSQSSGKFCSRSCKHEAWKTPSTDRGFEDLTKLSPFGRWSVISFSHRDGQHLYWKCRCSCEARTERLILGHSLKAGASTSCGCLAKEGKPRPDFKQCRLCKQTLPFTEEHFVSKPWFRWGLRPCCKTCWAPIRKQRHLAWRRRLKLEVITHYAGGSPACLCCGEKHVELLTLDHVNNDGKEDRAIRGAGTRFYSLLKQSGYPSDPPLCVLCFNCNIGRALFGKCPHQK